MTANPTIVIDHNDTPTALTVRSLLDEGSRPGEPELLSFQGIAQQVHSLRDLLDPQDIERPMSQGAARFDRESGKLGFMFRGVEAGTWESPMSFTSNGLRQFGHRLLGSGGATKFVMRQAARGPTGISMAEMNLAVELAAQGGEVTRLRTIQLPGEPVRSIRAALSQSYGCFDNVDVLDALLQAEGIDELHVVSANIDEDAMRIRFLLNPEDARLWDGDRIREEGLNTPLAMAELWNSEVGKSSLNFRSGLWQARCTNMQMNSWTSGSDWRWFHRGGGEGFRRRVTDGLSNALKSARVNATGAIEKFEEAGKVAVNDAAALLRQWSGSFSLTARTRDAAIEALSNDTACAETVAPDGSAPLTTVLDAVTWAAQGAGSLFAQRDVEIAAGRIMERGLAAARRNGGSITVEPSN